MTTPPYRPAPPCAPDPYPVTLHVRLNIDTRGEWVADVLTRELKDGLLPLLLRHTEATLIGASDRRGRYFPYVPEDTLDVMEQQLAAGEPL